jgi:antitoxin ParD1/3/4
MTMNVSLSPQLEAMVKAKVASGLYTSASEVVREALRLMDQQDQMVSLKLQHLRVI